MDAPRSVITQLISGAGRHERGAQRRFTLAVAGAAPRSFAADVVTIGSSPRNDVVIDDATVSRHHARIELHGGELVVHDLGSTNGTTVDGVRIATAFLGEHARLGVGRSAIDFAVTAEVEEFAIHPGTELGRLRGRSLAMRRLFAALERIAATDATVLIQGESGTGKELIAEALHGKSRRASGPFVVVDCGALPATLIESELFGHERGAFTGAVQTRAGAFELADGGTLFLDEIGELDLVLQPRLLRALEGRQVKRLGAGQYRAVDVRVIAATNRDLPAMVSAGDFREDLYHRIAVVETRVPPLRERPEDVELLAEVFADDICEREPAARRDALTPQLVAALRTRHWPGNVRELRNLVERALLLAGVDPAVADRSAPPGPLGSMARGPARDPADDADDAPAFADDAVMTWPYATARQHVLDRFEQDYVGRALARSGGNVAQAARECKMERSYLFKLIRRHRLRGA
jgi:transcriptional regulator with GAF, ATPase, and Fis domain